MPTVLRQGPYRIGFHASDGREPRHVHVFRGEAQAKVWVDRVELAWNGGFTRRDLGVILRIVREHRELLILEWDAYFKS